MSLWAFLFGAVLCVGGHPAHRNDHVTYGGLPPRAGFARDHAIPLCLGGPDTAANVQYQSWDQARIKDRVEWQACEAYCAGHLTLDQARLLVKNWNSHHP